MGEGASSRSNQGQNAALQMTPSTVFRDPGLTGHAYRQGMRIDNWTGSHSEKNAQVWTKMGFKNSCKASLNSFRILDHNSCNKRFQNNLPRVHVKGSKQFIAKKFSFFTLSRFQYNISNAVRYTGPSTMCWKNGLIKRNITNRLQKSIDHRIAQAKMRQRSPTVGTWATRSPPLI